MEKDSSAKTVQYNKILIGEQKVVVESGDPAAANT